VRVLIKVQQMKGRCVFQRNGSSEPWFAGLSLCAAALKLSRDNDSVERLGTSGVIDVGEPLSPDSGKGSEGDNGDVSDETIGDCCICASICGCVCVNV